MKKDEQKKVIYVITVCMIGAVVICCVPYLFPTVYWAGPVRMTTFSSPALIIIRRHMAQEVASERISPVRASFPAR